MRIARVGISDRSVDGQCAGRAEIRLQIEPATARLAEIGDEADRALRQVDDLLDVLPIDLVDRAVELQPIVEQLVLGSDFVTRHRVGLVGRRC